MISGHNGGLFLHNFSDERLEDACRFPKLAFDPNPVVIKHDVVIVWGPGRNKSNITRSASIQTPRCQAHISTG